MLAVSLLTKVVIMDLFCFDITEIFFESNIDLILRFLGGCIDYCCTAQLTIWLIWFLCICYYGTAQLTIWLTYFSMNLFDFLFLTILFSLDLVCGDILFSLTFLESFSFFFNVLFFLFFFLAFQIFIFFPTFPFLVPIAKKMTVLI